MNMKYYARTFQNEANKWWRTLSINEMKAFEKKHNAIRIGGVTLPSSIAEIYDNEVLNKGTKSITVEVWA